MEGHSRHFQVHGSYKSAPASPPPPLFLPPLPAIAPLECSARLAARLVLRGSTRRCESERERERTRSSSFRVPRSLFHPLLPPSIFACELLRASRALLIMTQKT
uniref:Uncharacterized protein n=1 Tax=Oryza glumipatula TaxID=40148 RepID=A0A0E0BCJ9_9ORYZ